MSLKSIATLVIAVLGASAQSLPNFFQSLPNLFALPNGSGFVETYNINNTSIDLTGPFFQSLGTNDALGLASLAGTCGTCHDSPNVGDHSFPAPLNIGVGDLTSSLEVSYLPVITLRNGTTGATVQTTDPGRALITDCVPTSER